MSEKVYPYLYAIVKRKDNECSYGQPFVAYPHQLEGLLRNSLKGLEDSEFLDDYFVEILATYQYDCFGAIGELPIEDPSFDYLLPVKDFFWILINLMLPRRFLQMLKRDFAMFKNAPAIPCSSGSRVKDEHQLVMDGNNLTLKKVGEIDTQKQIASYVDGVSLSKMIERYKRGDASALDRRQGFFADVRGFDDNPAAVIDATRDLMRTVADQTATEPTEPIESTEPTEPAKGENE